MDILDKSVVQQLISDIESNDVKTRRVSEYKSYKMQEGGVKEYVTSELQRLFPESWHTMRVSDTTVIGKVVKKLGKAYKEAPIRQIFKGEEKNDVAQERYDEIIKEGNLNKVMKEYDKDNVRQKYALQWVNKTNGKYSFHSLKGFESFVIVDPVSHKLKAAILSYPDNNIMISTEGDGIKQNVAEQQADSSANTRTYAIWTDENHVIAEASSSEGVVKISYQEIEGNPGNVNPIGTVPFVFHSQSSSADLPFMNQLADQTVMFNVIQTDYFSASAIQGFSILLLKLHKGMNISSVHAGMTTAMTLPIIEGVETQPSAEYLSPDPDLAGMKEAGSTYIIEVLDDQGINAGEASGGTQKFTSALDRAISKADVQDTIAENQIDYASVENQMLRIIDAYETSEGSTIFNGATLAIAFPKPKIMISDSETLSNVEKRLDLGLTTKKKALMVLDPNMSEKDAEKELKEIDDEKKEAVKGFLDANKQEGSD